jgi:hypothetical protein
MPIVKSTRDRRVSRRDEVLEGEIVGRPQLPRDIERSTRRGVAKQVGRGVVNKTRVITTAQVAETGLDFLGRLEDDEAEAVARNQFTGGARQRRIVNAFGHVVEDAVLRTGGMYDY